MAADEHDPEVGPTEPGERLQAAALELIDAARSVLDAVEQVVADPHTSAQVTGWISEIAQSASRLAGDAAARGRRATGGRGDGTDGPGDAGDDDDGDDGGVQRIPVS